MLRSIVLAGALALVPAIVAAADVWRWEDGDGRVHYSNQQEIVPTDAEVVRTQIRVVPRRASAPAARRSYVSAPGTRATGGGAWGGGCCFSNPYWFVIQNNPHELSDQVKQANLLDALGVSWRGGNCR